MHSNSSDSGGNSSRANSSSFLDVNSGGSSTRNDGVVNHCRQWHSGLEDGQWSHFPDFGYYWHWGHLGIDC